MEPTHSQLCTGFHNAEEGQKDKLRWYEAIWKSPYHLVTKNLMTQTIAIIDYGMGNLGSVHKAIAYVAPNDHIMVTADPSCIAAADRVIFPGQGAARDCMAAIQQQQLEPVIREAAQQKPFLGICMGLQVLMSRSTENQGTSLLNLFPGQVQKINTTLDNKTTLPRKIPHMGWNQVTLCQQHPLWQGIAPNSRFYFVHSYHIVPDNPNIISAITEYGQRITAAIAQGTLFACQFHPEKSADIGLQLLRNFVSWKPAL